MPSINFRRIWPCVCLLKQQLASKYETSNMPVALIG